MDNLKGIWDSMKTTEKKIASKKDEEKRKALQIINASRCSALLLKYEFPEYDTPWYCPPPLSIQRLKQDMAALPPKCPSPVQTNCPPLSYEYAAYHPSKAHQNKLWGAPSFPFCQNGISVKTEQSVS